MFDVNHSHFIFLMASTSHSYLLCYYSVWLLSVTHLNFGLASTENELKTGERRKELLDHSPNSNMTVQHLRLNHGTIQDPSICCVISVLPSPSSASSSSSGIKGKA